MMFTYVKHISVSGLPFGWSLNLDILMLVRSLLNVTSFKMSTRPHYPNRNLHTLHLLSSCFSSSHLLPPDFSENYFPLSISPHNHPKHFSFAWDFSSVRTEIPVSGETPPSPSNRDSCLSYLTVGWKLCESKADFWFHCCMYPQQLEQCLALGSSKINICWMNEWVCKITRKAW